MLTKLQAAYQSALLQTALTAVIHHIKMAASGEGMLGLSPSLKTGRCGVVYLGGISRFMVHCCGIPCRRFSDCIVMAHI
ncbi:hypothetical protein KCP76_02725 [Salmonella enterica subsp. enterica serovar Weltevreden]|nr:hypothetical protein KCP76_02725 [Salmonella enterica subsp. enterica serovar Weltevreden]